MLTSVKQKQQIFNTWSSVFPSLREEIEDLAYHLGLYNERIHHISEVISSMDSGLGYANTSLDEDQASMKVEQILGGEIPHITFFDADSGIEQPFAEGLMLLPKSSLGRKMIQQILQEDQPIAERKNLVIVLNPSDISAFNDGVSVVEEATEDEDEDYKKLGQLVQELGAENTGVMLVGAEDVNDLTVVTGEASVRALKVTLNEFTHFLQFINVGAFAEEDHIMDDFNPRKLAVEWESDLVEQAVIEEIGASIGQPLTTSVGRHGLLPPDHGYSFPVADILGINVPNPYQEQDTKFENLLIGTNSDEYIEGQSSDEIISALDGNDTIYAGAGNDILVGGTGDDIIDGGEGTNVAVFSGTKDDYLVMSDGDTTTVTDLKPHFDGDDGTDTLTNVSILRFNNGDLSANNQLVFAREDDALSISTPWEEYHLIDFYDRDLAKQPKFNLADTQLGVNIYSYLGEDTILITEDVSSLEEGQSLAFKNQGDYVHIVDANNQPSIEDIIDSSSRQTANQSDDQLVLFADDVNEIVITDSIINEDIIINSIGGADINRNIDSNLSTLVDSLSDFADSFDLSSDLSHHTIAQANNNPLIITDKLRSLTFSS
jgi:hypothetical protein